MKRVLGIGGRCGPNLVDYDHDYDHDAWPQSPGDQHWRLGSGESD